MQHGLFQAHVFSICSLVYSVPVIALLIGKVVEREPKAVVLDVRGVGYRVMVLSTLLNTVAVGHDVTLRIYHHVTDEAEALYGFANKEDVRFFELLLTVPSVGPKTALNILEIAPPRILARAVATEDVKLLTKVSGVGRKTADRILIELKEKFKKESVSGMVGDIHETTMSVLINMGFSRAQAREVVQNLPSTVETVEEAVKVALKRT